MLWIILVVCMLLLFVGCYICTYIFTERESQRIREELSNRSDVYTGPAGDPFWDGTLPKKVTDYVAPRYVYENLEESLDYLPENGRIIGYRISPTLVIHSRLQHDVNPSCLEAYLTRFNGKLLRGNEILLMQQNWSAVSALRQKAGDTPLNIEWFWACPKEIPMVVHYKDNLCRNMIDFNTAWYPLLLKR